MTAGGAVLAAALFVTTGGCSRREPDNDLRLSPAALAAAAPPGSRYPNLVAQPGGGAVLSWVAQQADGSHALQYARWTGEAWGDPHTAAAGAGWFVNWADFASVVPLGNGLWAAHWLEQRPASTYAYDVRMSISSDDGASWSAPMTPHDDGTPTEHGFVSITRIGDRVAAVWLDGRNTGGGERADDHDTSQGAMTLRSALLDTSGRAAGGDTELDDRVCDCCQTDVAATPEGPVVAYRDRDAREVRDIAVVRASPDGWTSPTIVHHDGWRIDACPVNGPAIAAHDRTLAVAWFTAPDRPRVRLAFSDDAGVSFTPALEVAADRLAGRVDVVLLDPNRAVVSWLADSAQGAELRAQVWTRDGPAAAPVTVARTTIDRASGFPRMSRAGDVLLFAWTEVAATPRVRTAVLRLR